MIDLYENPDTRIPMSDKQRKQLKKWYKLAKRKILPVPFNIKRFGLCTNITGFESTLYEENIKNCRFPFGREEYVEASAYNTQHKCPRRLAFVEANLP